MSIASDIKTDLDSSEWVQQLSQKISEHTNKEYEDDKKYFAHKKDKNIITRKITFGKGRKKQEEILTVHRKRHGLAHSMRQAFIAVDVVKAFAEIGDEQENYFNHREADNCAIWATRMMKEDPLFLTKIHFASAFQRTGRESETSGHGGADQLALYESYLRKDGDNFEEYAKNHVGPDLLFKSDEELKMYKQALIPAINIVWSDNHEKNMELFSLRKIFSLAHMLDLRRCPHLNVAYDIAFDDCFAQYDQNGVLLSTKPERTVVRQDFVNALWSRTGDYIAVTGDRDQVTKQKRFRDRFFILSNRPSELANTLMTVSRQPFSVMNGN